MANLSLDDVGLARFSSVLRRSNASRAQNEERARVENTSARINWGVVLVLAINLGVWVGLAWLIWG